MPTDYTLMDATSEILLMLLAAFLLGWFFCWLIKKLFGKKPRAISKAPLNVNDTTVARPERTGIISSNRERVYSTDTDFDQDLSAPELASPEINLTEVDLPKKVNIEAPKVDIEEPTIAKARPRIDLPDFNTPELGLEDKLAGGKATLGKGLGMATAGIGAVAVGASSFKDKVVDKVEDLKMDVKTDIPEMPDLTLNETEIDLPDLDKAAELGTEIDLPNIDIENLDADVELPEMPSALVDLDVDQPSTSEALSEAEELNHQAADNINKPAGATNDLTRITGIDNQVAEVLNAKKIFNYQDLQASNRTQLKEYLDATGDPKMREIEPASWPHQATLCANGNWSKLSEYQSFLTGSNLGVRQTPSSSEASSADDLKKVEGIGPFFESLLNDAGITTYEQLKNSDRDTLKEIIDAAGPDYRMHEPETWPYQAGLAYRGEWKKLQDYIHFMTGRS